MSLLEDIFLRDEANEAKELERIIEGDDYDEKPQQRSDSDDNSEKEDEAEEEKRRVDPSSTKTKRAVKNPRFVLNPARLTGPRGIQVIPDHFKDFKFKGKGHEKEDLDLVLKKLEHWAYRLYPKFQFEDCLKKIEILGKKRPVMVHLHKIRSDQYITEDTIVQKDSSDDEGVPIEREEDEFDKLLQQQIDLARSTPGPGSVKKTALESSVIERSVTAPKATSSPSISEEQRERMIRSRKLAEEKRLARLKNNVSMNTTISDNKESNVTTHTTLKYSTETINAEQTIEANPVINIDIDDTTKPKKHNRTNVIDSSDEEDDVMSVSEPVTVDIHSNRNNDIIVSDYNPNKFNGENKTVNDFDGILNHVNEKDDIAISNKNEDIAKIKHLDKPNQTDTLNNTINFDIISENKEQNNDCDNKIDNMETQININEHKTFSDEIEINSNQNEREVTNHENNSKSLGEAETVSYVEQSQTITNTILIDKNVVKSNANDAKIVDDIPTINTEDSVKAKESEMNNPFENDGKEAMKLNEDISKDLDDDLMDVDFSEDF